jgi:hypothetical protein
MPAAEELRLVVVNGEYSTPDRPSAISHNQQQGRVLVLGGAMLMASFVMFGVDRFVTDNSENKALYGQLLLVEALLQTIGAMAVAASDIDIDLFAKRHPVCVLAFAVSWIVFYRGLGALAYPILAVKQTLWVAALPFAYLLLHRKVVLQIRSEYYPRFSDLFAYSLALVLMNHGVYFFLFANTYIGSPLFPYKRIWPANLISSIYLLGGTILLGLYLYLRSHHSRRLALSITLYAYLLANGGCYLSNQLIRQFIYIAPIPLIDYGFPIIHIAFPFAYFLFNPLIYSYLGHYWLKQRSANRDSIAQEQGIAPHHGNLAAVEQALGAATDLNAHTEGDLGDTFTLLTLACFNGHEDAVDLLLSQDDVQVNKGSRRLNWTPLYMAAMRGHSTIVERLIMGGANVHTWTEDEQSALMVATIYGHTQIVQQLMEAGASRKRSAWMGVDAANAAEAQGHAGVVATLRSYESHFQGNIREVRGCTCVVSWPGIYSKCWDNLVAQGKRSKLSAAVVFLPKDTLYYGKCGSDKCYCVEMYGAKKQWGCKVSFAVFGVAH